MTTVHTTCTRDCPDTGAVIAHVEDGRVIKLAGDPAYPITRGFLCKKNYRYPARVYSAERIGYPLKRTKNGTQKPPSIHLGMGPQRWRAGAELFQYIDALAALTGNLGVPGGGVNYSSRLAALLDLSWLAENRAQAKRFVLRASIGRDVLETRDPPLRLAWICGANPVTQALNSGVIRQALAQLEYVVVSDIYRTDTAQYAHLFLPTTTFVEEEDLVVTEWWHSYLGYIWQDQYAPQLTGPRSGAPQAPPGLGISRGIGRRGLSGGHRSGGGVAARQHAGASAR
jgi:anaerobic selenocysteine-containing dehydrogenase